MMLWEAYNINSSRSTHTVDRNSSLRLSTSLHVDTTNWLAVLNKLSIGALRHSIRINSTISLTNTKQCGDRLTSSKQRLI